MSTPVTVVVADDHPVFRAGIRDALEKGGQVEVVGEAADGAEALKVVRRLRPDVLLLDMNMPVMTGWDAAKELKKDGAPIIALTAQKTHDEQVAAHEAGCDTFVEKPIDPARLLEAVKRVLG